MFIKIKDLIRENMFYKYKKIDIIATPPWTTMSKAMTIRSLIVRLHRYLTSRIMIFPNHTHQSKTATT